MTFDWVNWENRREREWVSELCGIYLCVVGGSNESSVRRVRNTCSLGCSLFMTVIIKYCSVERFLPFLSFIRMNEMMFSAYSFRKILDIEIHTPALRQVTRYLLSLYIHTMEFCIETHKKYKLVYLWSLCSIHVYIALCTVYTFNNAQCNSTAQAHTQKWFIFTDKMLQRKISVRQSVYNDIIFFYFFSSSSCVVFFSLLSFVRWKMTRARKFVLRNRFSTIRKKNSCFFDTRIQKRKDYGAIIIRLEK